MEHVVFFPAHDGSPAFRRVGSLEDAVRLVEHLRNVENVSEVSVHTLAEVPLAFKPYYKVEVPAGEEGLAGPPPQPVQLAPEPTPAAPMQVVPDAPSEAAAPQAVATPIAVEPDAPAAVPAAEQAEAVVPEQGEATDETADARESGAASLGFFAS